MKRLLWIAVWILVSLTACAPPPPPTALPAATATLRPTEIPTPRPTIPPTWTPEPSPTSTPTAIPTVNPAAISATVKRGLARMQAAAGDADIVCLRRQDLDSDGEPEWIALTHQTAITPTRLVGFILDGEEFYPLATALPEPGEPDYGLGQYATCEIEVRDVNADGWPELAIFGHAEQNETRMHLYIWDENEYRLLGAFSGNAGIFFEDGDGDLSEEIIERHRDRGAPSLAWDIIFTWDGRTYGWTLDRWSWFALDRPHAYPTNKPEYAVASFYLAVDDRDLPGAYALLATATQATRPYGEWVQGFATTLRVDVGALHQFSGVGDENNARVAAMITSWDNEAGRVIMRIWDVEWSAVRSPEGWRLVEATMTLLDEWEAPYWR